jgi:hypothetical protein
MKKWEGSRLIQRLDRAYAASHNENPVKVKFTLEQAMKAQRRNRGIALLFV